MTVRTVGNMTPLVTAECVAMYLGVSKARVYQACHEGLLPHVRLGRSLRFSPDELAAWADNNGSSYPGGWRKEVVE